MNSKTDLYHRFQQEGWQRAAAAYDSAWRGLTRPFALDLVRTAGVTRGTRLLDLACGPGYAAEAAFERGAIPLGVDFSSEMIRMAKQRLPLIRFCEGDARALEFPDHSFDAVVMNFGLPHMSDPGTVLREARRVLKPVPWYSNPKPASGKYRPPPFCLKRNSMPGSGPRLFSGHSDPRFSWPSKRKLKGPCWPIGPGPALPFPLPPISLR